MAWQLQFRSLYAEARKRHNDVLSLPNETVDGICTRLLSSQVNYASARYPLICTAATITIVAGCLLVGQLIRSLHAYTMEINHVLTNKQFWSSHDDLVMAVFWWACGLSIYSAVPFLFLRIDSSSSIGPLRARVYRNVNSRSRSVRLFAIIVAYAIAPVLVVAFANNFRHPSTLLPIALGLWIGIPLLFMLILVIAALLIAFFGKYIERAKRDASVQRLSVTLLKMLRRLDDLGHFNLLTSRERRQLVDDIVRVSQDLADLHDFRADPASEWARTQMRQAADNFLRLVAWVYFPQEGTLSSLRAEVIKYLNILLSGNFHELPRGLVGAEAGFVLRDTELKGWRKFAMHAGIAIYLMLPVLVFAILTKFFNLQLTGILQTVISLLYLLWVIVGFFSLSDRISPDARALLADTIKAIAGRK